MTFEEREGHYKRLRLAARKDMESWEEAKSESERNEADNTFREQWMGKIAYDEAQSSARRNIGDMSSIGKRFW